MDICERCYITPAIFSLREIEAGVVKDRRLCEACGALERKEHENWARSAPPLCSSPERMESLRPTGLPPKVRLPARVQVSKLAESLGLPAPQVMGVLARLEVYAKSEDWIEFAVAKEVGELFGVAVELEVG